MLAAAYFVSGFAGLVYEVTWTRLLTLRLGHSTAAVSTVLAAFMGGLALGALFGSRYAAHRSSRGARFAYAALEAAVILFALLLPFLLDALTPFLRWAYADDGPGTAFAIVRVVTTLLVLMIPALALGATFPCVVKALEGRRISSAALYAINTCGAALGAIAAGFLLLPSLGLNGSTAVAVCASAVSVVLAVAASGASQAQEQPAAAVPRSSRKGSVAPSPIPATPVARPVLWLIVALTGIATFVLEIGWTRLFALLVGPSTYAFAGVLAISIVCLAGGSALAARLASSRLDAAACLAVVLGVAAALAASSERLAGDTIPRVIAETMIVGSSSFLSRVASGARAMGMVMAPVMCALGAAFPLALKLAERSTGNKTGSIGPIYAVNTAAGLIGSLAAGFVILPAWGVEGALNAASVALIGAATAAVMALALSRGWRSTAAALTLVAVVAAATPSAWDQRLLASGIYKYGRFITTADDLDVMLAAGDLRYYRDGAAATVTVRDFAGVRSLAIDGKVDASTGGDMLTQKLLAHLPLLLHDNPKKVAIIGLGSGVTAGAALTHPVNAVDVVELSPEVVTASRLFDVENRAALDDPRTRLIVGDGRSHLLLTSTRYDVIVSEPSNPWMAGVASLFTQEFFVAARAGLTPGGILCQWAHVYDISAEDLRSIVGTFLSVFPAGTMWLVGEGDLLLIGSDERLASRLTGLTRHVQRPGVAEDLARVGVHDAFALLASYVGDGEQMMKYAGEAPVQRDRMMALEFSGPRAVNNPLHDNSPALLALQAEGRRSSVAGVAVDGATPAQWRDYGAMLERAGAFALAYDSYARSLDSDADDVHAAFGVLSAAGPARRVEEAGRLLSRTVAAHPRASATKAALSKWLASTGDVRGAIEVALSACESTAAAVEACGQLASIYVDAGDANGLAPIAAMMAERFPESPETRYAQAALAFLSGDLAAAQQYGERATGAGVRRAAAWNLLGAVAATRGDGMAARRAFAAAIALEPRDTTAYVNLGQFELLNGDRAAAVRWFAEALSIDPASEPSRQGLVAAQRRQR